MSEGWAVILGASAGTGAAIARRVGRDPGMRVFGVHRGRYDDLAGAVVADVEAKGGAMVMHRGDAGTAEGAALCAAHLEALAGPRSVRLFVHSIASASVGHLAAGDPMHPRQIQKTFDAMAHSFVYWARELLDRDLLAPGARLLGLTNPLDTTLLGNTALISASKAALEVYIRHLAIELGPLGHRVNLLKFGTVMTPALDHVYSPEALLRLRANHERMIPAGRMCTVEEIADFVALLCRPDVDWFNGATIDFSGGMTLRLLDLVLNEGDAAKKSPEP